ncbi:MAG: SRPBCC family protein [Acidimicrobiia bacterium]
MTKYQEQSSASIEIEAAPDVVWGLIADITRMGEWSPECVRAEWEDGATGPTVGAHFHGYNRAGTYEWDAPCIVTDCEPGTVFAFKVPRGDDASPTVWRFEIRPNGSGTTLTESFDAPRINVAGMPSNFEGRFEMLDAAINTTIANIKAAAEAQPG